MGDEAERDAREAPPGRLSIGRYLSAQRRLRGITLDELAERTRIPRRNLERLESGAFDDQPDGFVRGFVRTVADALGLDAQEAVMRLVGEPVAADEEWHQRRRIWATWLAVAVAAIALLLLAWALRSATRWVAEPAPDASPEHVYRPDAVRSLVERAEADAPDDEADR